MFASCGQEAFFEGHVYALRTLGGVPRGTVRYDNLTPAVARVLSGRGRTETDRWVALRSHYSFDAFYCQPGAEGAHEKGGVEGQVGYFRRNRLVPVPEVASLAELNGLVEAWDADDDGRRIGRRARTVGEYFAAERRLLAPLPDTEFEPGWATTARVDRYGQVSVRANRYSVPVRLAGRRVRVLLRANELACYDGAELVATHARLPGRGQVRLELDHYLDVLVRKPGALAGATALEQARAAGTFTATHEAWWAAARAAHGDAAGTCALVEVLLLHRHTDHAQVVAGIAAALAAGALTADAVAVEARKAAQDSAAEDSAAEASPAGADAGPVASLTARRLAALPADTRPLPSVAAYDQLLPTRRRGGTP